MQISTATIVRTVLLVLALLNQVLTISGYSPIPLEDETVNEFIATGSTIIIAIVTWWKNNSFTQAAIQADRVMKDIKTQKNS